MIIKYLSNDLFVVQTKNRFNRPVCLVRYVLFYTISFNIRYHLIYLFYKFYNEYAYKKKRNYLIERSLISKSIQNMLKIQ